MSPHLVILPNFKSKALAMDKSIEEDGSCILPRISERD